MPCIRALGAALVVAFTIVPAASSLAADASVSIVDKAFTPANVTIEYGEAVTWIWDAGGHNVHVAEGQGPVPFDSGFLDQGATFRRVLTAPGTYRYVCDAHPSMRGVITVTGPTDVFAPAPGATDSAPPRLSAVRVSPRAFVRLRSSSTGTVRLRLARGSRTARRWTVPVDAGVNRVPLEVGRLAVGRYRLELTAVSAAGDTSARVVRSVRVTRSLRAAARRLSTAGPGSAERTAATAPAAPVSPQNVAAPAPAPAGELEHDEDGPDDSDGRVRARDDD